jgi:hypothetical protein
MFWVLYCKREVTVGFKSAVKQVAHSFRQLDVTDLRWTHFAIVGMVIGGAVINLFLHNGWTVWPLVMVAALMTAVHEAADRAGQGVPPLTVYACFAGAIFLWIGLVMVLSAVNMLVIIAAILALAYFSAKGWLKTRIRQELIQYRIAHDLCVYCGEPSSTNLEYCENCGMEPNPVTAEARRLSDSTHRNANATHARSVLKGEAMGASAARKEQALLAMRRAGKKPKR